MLKLSTLMLALFLGIASAHRPAAAASEFGAPPDTLLGRWDITISTPEGPRPSWLDVWHSGRAALVGRFVGVSGSARPIGGVAVSGDSMRFAIPPQWEDGTGDLIVEGRIQGDRLSG